MSTTDRQNLETAWFFYLAEIATNRIIGNVFKWLSNVKETSDQDLDKMLETGATEFDRQIQEW